MLNSEGYMGLEAQKITPDSDMYKWLAKVRPGRALACQYSP
jgi:hypothetical protein